MSSKSASNRPFRAVSTALSPSSTITALAPIRSIISFIKSRFVGVSSATSNRNPTQLRPVGFFLTRGASSGSPFASAKGKRTVTAVPLPSFDFRVTEPPMASASLRVIARPSPLPPKRRAVD